MRQNGIAEHGYPSARRAGRPRESVRRAHRGTAMTTTARVTACASSIEHERPKTTPRLVEPTHARREILGSGDLTWYPCFQSPCADVARAVPCHAPAAKSVLWHSTLPAVLMSLRYR